MDVGRKRISTKNQQKISKLANQSVIDKYQQHETTHRYTNLSTVNVDEDTDEIPVSLEYELVYSGAPTYQLRTSSSWKGDVSGEGEEGKDNGKEGKGGGVYAMTWSRDLRGSSILGSDKAQESRCVDGCMRSTIQSAPIPYSAYVKESPRYTIEYDPISPTPLLLHSSSSRPAPPAVVPNLSTEVVKVVVEVVGSPCFDTSSSRVWTERKDPRNLGDEGIESRPLHDILDPPPSSSSTITAEAITASAEVCCGHFRRAFRLQQES
ncbi:hypothetical protein BC629DRAFT_1729156 [Irpex lacteus]|nr:hypothetical protein BC629DRAFT_1729156 [Irpex lacteus]